MKTAQPGILAPVPPQGRYLFFTLKQASALREALMRLAPLVDGPQAVVGLSARSRRFATGAAPTATAAT